MSVSAATLAGIRLIFLRLRGGNASAAASNMRVIILEGLIGAGKSCLLKNIQPYLTPEVKVIMEPVDRFQSFDSYNPLGEMYENPMMNSGFGQLHIIQEQALCYEEQLREEKPAILLTERSIYSPVIFTKTLRSAGFLSEFVEAVLLKHSHQKILEIFPDKPLAADKMFWVDTPISVCLSHIAQRGREGESAITESYLSKLSTFYGEYIDLMLEQKKPVRSVAFDDPTLQRQLLDFIYAP